MMKSAILCEGGTDLVLIQYFMEKTYKWTYIKESDESSFSEVNKIVNCNKIKWFRKDAHFLAIISVGSCSKLENGFNEVISYNGITAYPDIAFDNIVIVTDRDEISSEVDFINKFTNVLTSNSVFSNSALANSKWTEISYYNAKKDLTRGYILLLVIPFEETGALETFLLKAVSQNDNTGTEKKTIDQCCHFVDTIDTDNKYLQHRRHVTKAKFDTYFSVRTPLEQFGERRDILKNIDWHEYEKVQETFKEFKKLGEQLW